ncbi:MAG: DUF6065 family protein [Rubrobacter sp.]
MDRSGGARLTAYRTAPSEVRLAPASRSRAWMDAIPHRFANRCLPLRMANGAGWFVLNDRTIRATWDGGPHKSAVRVEPLEESEDDAPLYASGHFGYGILTFHVPYLIKTPSGYNLLARGPANRPKDGIHPLEGLVETDWSVASFTMNWQLTRPDHPVVFEAGEPVCMLVPQRRGELEAFEPEVCDLNEALEVAYDYWKWTESRWNFMTAEGRRQAEGRVDGEEGVRSNSQLHYTRGTSPTGTGAGEHQTRLRLRAFEERRRDG